MPKLTGDILNEEWNIGARQTRYRETGDFYMPLEQFPGALCDANGYVVFTTREEYEHSPYLKFSSGRNGIRVTVRPSLENLPGYIRRRP
jgi:hypothetical protein